MMGYKNFILNVAEKISGKMITWKTPGKEFNDEVDKELQEIGCEDGRSMNTHNHKL
jgi:hypothetical protein